MTNLFIFVFNNLIMKIVVLIVLIGAALARDEYFFAGLRDSEFGKTIIQTL